MAWFGVEGTYGRLRCALPTGEVLEYSWPDDGTPPEYSDISVIDVAEYDAWCAEHAPGERITAGEFYDIVDVSFVTTAAEYVPAELIQRAKGLRLQIVAA